MRRSRFTDEQIVGILHEGEAGRKVEELYRAHGIAASSSADVCCHTTRINPSGRRGTNRRLSAYSG